MIEASRVEAVAPAHADSPQTPAATRAAGLARLDAFAPRAGRIYAADRNTDYGPDADDSVSHLSPYLRHRLVLEPEAIAAALSRHSVNAAEKFVQEVVWRGYFKGWLEQRPSVWSDYRRRVRADLARLDADSALDARYRAAVEGRTGIACFDAWATELAATGYLHNHARMWTASIWLFTLGLPWSLGADWFYRHLLDGDPASNTLSWRWVAGLHTRGKTYLARADNIARFTNGRFQPTPDSLASDAPALDEPAPPPAAMPAAPAPLPSDGAPVGLLLTEEDGHAESLGLDGATVAGVATLSAAEHRSPLAVSAAVVGFTGDAVADAAARAAAHWNVTAETLPAGVQWGDALAAWAQRLGVTRIVTAELPQGPAREALDTAQPTLDTAGLALYRIRRPYDAAIWPHATAGFFKVKKRIPKLLSELSLA
ncbi:deoxyribodipyrimidine photo-lyase [Rhodothalassium salexigens DSM 2132]|uniref:Deoxyribodipyrimidine photo-lyase n=1 Tax=Rhodothalassium salexigens DSM 2132 TaxID=1188247 RepID=A0A4R2PC67_RHOSA|nr:FAD-binding domain-containing protein [Rhodothalassium salexigens]MBB4212201.1 deoxyribodipyrimidine photo-lyase [Rhodothalassium salexigens DSM 2132]TCP32647.1 deoxyribodipyrimidine photo-lyase [Rhodothalassium salexigens DSM 2132]